MKYLLISLILVLVPFRFAIEKEQPSNVSRPNILWIVTEDMDPDLGCYGNPWTNTPNLDALASEGIRYNRAYSASPVCSPARSSLFTGMYNIRIGSHQHRTKEKKELPEGVQLVTNRLEKSGYYICNLQAMFKDINLTSKTDFNFVSKDVFPGQGWNTIPDKIPFFGYLNIREPKPFLWEASEKWAKEHDQLVNPDDIIVPPYYPDTPKTRKWMAQYYQGISHMDWKVGQVIEKLKADGLYDNTVIFYFSDHGKAMVRHKQWLYEGGIKVPLIIRWPEAVRARSISDHLVSLIDVTGTTIEIARAQVSGKIDGRVIPEFGGEPRQYIFTSRDRCDGTEERIRAVNNKKYKLIRNYRNDVGYVQKNSYYIEAMLKPMPEFRRLQIKDSLSRSQARWFDQTKAFEELYDLEKDPYELNNLVDSQDHKNILQTLQEQLDFWLEDTGDKGRIKEDPSIAKKSKALMRKLYWDKIDPEVRKHMN